MSEQSNISRSSTLFQIYFHFFNWQFRKKIKRKKRILVLEKWRQNKYSIFNPILKFNFEYFLSKWKFNGTLKGMSMFCHFFFLSVLLYNILYYLLGNKKNKLLRVLTKFYILIDENETRKNIHVAIKSII